MCLNPLLLVNIIVRDSLWGGIMLNNIGKKIREAREEKSLTQKGLGKIINKSAQVISNWERGYTSTINHDDISKLAAALDKNFNYLLAGNDRDGISPTNAEKTVPVFRIVTSELPMFINENIVGYQVVPPGEASGGEYFYFQVSGDSMIGSHIFDGSMVYVHKQNEVDDGDIALVAVNDDKAALKRIYRLNGKIVLQPDNPKYKPLILNKEDTIKIIGKVLHVITKV